MMLSPIRGFPLQLAVLFLGIADVSQAAIVYDQSCNGTQGAPLQVEFVYSLPLRDTHMSL